MRNIAIIMTEAELERRIQEALDKKFAALSDRLETEKALPIELSCKEAAAVLGVSATTFLLRCRSVQKYSVLKRQRGGRVYVLSNDLKAL